MSKVVVAGNVFVVKSKLTPEQFELLSKHNAEALFLHDEDKARTFGICYDPASKGSLGRYGVTFNAVSCDEDKVACVTVQLPANVTNAAEYIAAEYGAIIDNIKTVEAGLPAAISAIKTRIEAVKADITVI